MKKRNTASLVLLLVAGLIAGCGGSVLNKIKKGGWVLVGTVPFEAPFLYQKEQQLVGPDAELAQRLVDMVGGLGNTLEIELKWITRSYEGLIPALENGEVDLVLGVFGITEERRKRVAFSEPYYTSELGLIINPIRRDLRDTVLTGAKIGVREDTAIEVLVKREFADSSSIGYQTLDDAILALKRGEVDAVIDDRSMAAYSLDTVPGANFLEIVPGNVGTLDFGVAVHPSHEDLLKIINDVIREMKANDQYAQWLGEQMGDRMARVEQRFAQRHLPRGVVIRISKDAGNSFDIYRMANLRFVLKGEEDGKTYSTSRIKFRGRVGVTSTEVPPGTYSLSLPKFKFNAGKVSIGATDPIEVNITIRLKANNSVVVTKV